MEKKFAITKASAAAALRYGPTVSKGIAEMDATIKRLTAENKDLICSRRKKIENLLAKEKQS